MGKKISGSASIRFPSRFVRVKGQIWIPNQPKGMTNIKIELLFL